MHFIVCISDYFWYYYKIRA